MSSKTYTTRQGDTWDVIAKRLWGRETLMHELLVSNPDHGDVLVFGPDVTLEIPDVAIPPHTADLPPWYTAPGGKA